MQWKGSWAVFPCPVLSSASHAAAFVSYQRTSTRTCERFLYRSYLIVLLTKFSSVAQSCPTLCDLMDCSRPGFPSPSPIPEACSNSCAWSQWCHPNISSSVVPVSCLQSFPASGVFCNESVLWIRWPSIGVTASASVLQPHLVPLCWGIIIIIIIISCWDDYLRTLTILTSIILRRVHNWHAWVYRNSLSG